MTHCKKCGRQMLDLELGGRTFQSCVNLDCHDCKTAEIYVMKWAGTVATGEGMEVVELPLANPITVR